MKSIAIATVVLAVLAGRGAPVSAEPDGDQIDKTMRKALDEVYQHDLPGWDDRGDGGDGLVLGGGGGGGSGGRRGSGLGPGSAGVTPPTGGSGGGSAGGGLGGSGGGSGAGGSADPLVVNPNDPANGSGSAGAGGNPDDNDGTPRTQNGTPGDPHRHGGHGDRGDRGYGHNGSVGNNGDAGPLGGIATVLLWGVVIILAILLILAIVRGTSGITGEEAPVTTASDDDDEDPARLLAVVEKPRDDADQLAHEGKFADAIHTLLLRTLHELASQNMVRITAAMTSREVLARVPLLGDSRTALAGLVAAVEVTWFGDDVPGPADYQRCREQFELFAAAYRRGAQGQPAGRGAAQGARA